MLSETKYKAECGQGLKILTSKQMLQILPTALAQVKAGDIFRLLLNLRDKTNLKRSGKDVALSNLNNYYTWKNIKRLYKNNKFKISAPTWNEKFELTDG